MTTTPAGVAPWTRAVGIADYGGNAAKTDYLGIGVVNPKTDISAAQLLRLTNDLAAVVRGAPFCTITFVCPASPSTDNPTVTAVTGMIWNYSGAGYPGGTPPTGYPAVVRIANGHWRVSFASSYTDSYGVSGAVSVRSVMPTVSGSAYAANYTLVSATVVSAYVINRSDGLAVTDAVTPTLAIW